MSIYRGTTPEIRAVLRHLHAHGCAVTRGRSGHWRVSDSRGFLFALPNSPGTRRVAANTGRLLRAAGIPALPTVRHLSKADRAAAAPPAGAGPGRQSRTARGATLFGSTRTGRGQSC